MTERPTCEKNALKVHNIGEEYLWVHLQECDACEGVGTLELSRQWLTMDTAGKPLDVLSCECSECGKPVDFYFDISEFFPISWPPQP